MNASDRERLIEILENISESVYHWNQSEVTEDQGPRSDALCIIIYEDGSSMVGRPDDIRDGGQFFDTPEELADFLIENHIEAGP